MQLHSGPWPSLLLNTTVWLIPPLPTAITYRLSGPGAGNEKQVQASLQQGGLPAPYRLAVLLMFDLAGATLTVVDKANKLRQLPVSSPRLHQALAATQLAGGRDRPRRQVLPGAAAPHPPLQ